MNASAEKGVRWAALVVILTVTILIAGEAYPSPQIVAAAWSGLTAASALRTAVASRATGQAQCGEINELSSQSVIYAFFLPLGHDPVPVDTAGRRFVGEIAREAVAELALPAKLGRAVTAADVRLFLISREEARRLIAGARAVPESQKGAPLSALDAFDANAVCAGSCLLLELKEPAAPGREELPVTPITPPVKTVNVSSIQSAAPSSRSVPSAPTAGSQIAAPEYCTAAAATSLPAARTDNGPCVFVYDRDAGRTCLASRTVFVLGNSIARGFAFEADSMFGERGQTVERNQQKEFCDKAQLHDFPHGGMASCVISLGLNTQIRYTWMQFFDDMGPRMDGDACTGAGLMPARRCLERILDSSKPGDILLFYMGLHYAFSWLGHLEAQPPFPVDSWLIKSSNSWKESILSLWKGRHEDVFRVRLADHANADPTKASGTARVFDHVPHINDIMDMTFADMKWGVINQWAINQGQQKLYQDPVHFQGPLSQATWHVLLSSLCGNPRVVASSPFPTSAASLPASSFTALPFPRIPVPVRRVIVLSIYVVPMPEVMKLHVATLSSNLQHPLVYAAVNNGFSPDQASKIAADTELVAQHFKGKVRVISVPKPTISDSEWRSGNCQPSWPSCDHGTKTVMAVKFLHTQADLALGPSDVLWLLDADMFLLTDLHSSPEMPGKTWNIMSVIFSHLPVPQPDDPFRPAKMTSCGPGEPRDCSTYYSYPWPNFALYTGFSGDELADMDFRPGFHDSGSNSAAIQLLLTSGLVAVNSSRAEYDGTNDSPWKLRPSHDAVLWAPEMDHAFLQNEPFDAAALCFSQHSLPHCKFVADQEAIAKLGGGCVRPAGLLIPGRTADTPAFVYHIGSATSNWRGCSESWIRQRFSDLQTFFLQQHPNGLIRFSASSPALPDSKADSQFELLTPSYLVALEDSLPLQGTLGSSSRAPHVVISAYDEDLAWVFDFFSVGWETTVYHKHPERASAFRAEVKHRGAAGINVLDLENWGDEAQPYLRFVVDNFDSLPRAIAFLHGGGNSHTKFILEMLRCLDPEWTRATRTTNFGTSGAAHGYFSLNNAYIGGRDMSHPLFLPVTKFINEQLEARNIALRIREPGQLSFYCCAQFIATPLAFLRLGKPFWEVMLAASQLHLPNGGVRKSTAVYFEHIWHELLGQKQHLDRVLAPPADVRKAPFMPQCYQTATGEETPFARFLRLEFRRRS